MQRTWETKRCSQSSQSPRSRQSPSPIYAIWDLRKGRGPGENTLKLHLPQASQVQIMRPRRQSYTLELPAAHSKFCSWYFSSFFPSSHLPDQSSGYRPSLLNINPDLAISSALHSSPASALEEESSLRSSSSIFTNFVTYPCTEEISSLSIAPGTFAHVSYRGRQKRKCSVRVPVLTAFQVIFHFLLRMNHTY